MPGPRANPGKKDPGKDIGATSVGSQEPGPCMDPRKDIAINVHGQERVVLDATTLPWTVSPVRVKSQCLPVRESCGGHAPPTPPSGDRLVGHGMETRSRRGKPRLVQGRNDREREEKGGRGGKGVAITEPGESRNGRGSPKHAERIVTARKDEAREGHLPGTNTAEAGRWGESAVCLALGGGRLGLASPPPYQRVDPSRSRRERIHSTPQTEEIGLEADWPHMGRCSKAAPSIGRCSPTEGGGVLGRSIDEQAGMGSGGREETACLDCIHGRWGRRRIRIYTPLECSPAATSPSDQDREACGDGMIKNPYERGMGGWGGSCRGGGMGRRDGSPTGNGRRNTDVNGVQKEGRKENNSPLELESVRGSRNRPRRARRGWEVTSGEDAGEAVKVQYERLGPVTRSRSRMQAKHGLQKAPPSV